MYVGRRPHPADALPLGESQPTLRRAPPDDTPGNARLPRRLVATVPTATTWWPERSQPHALASFPPDRPQDFLALRSTPRAATRRDAPRIPGRPAHGRTFAPVRCRVAAPRGAGRPAQTGRHKHRRVAEQRARTLLREEPSRRRRCAAYALVRLRALPVATRRRISPADPLPLGCRRSVDSSGPAARRRASNSSRSSSRSSRATESDEPGGAMMAERRRISGWLLRSMGARLRTSVLSGQ